MEVPLVIAAILALVVGAALILRRPRRGPESPSDSTDLVESGPAAQAETDDVVLVPLPTRRNEAIALGTNESLDAFERSGLGRRSGVRSAGPLPQVIRQVANFGGQAANRRADMQIDAGRIVALSDETMEQLRKNKAVHDKAGQMLGVVRGDKGKMVHVMRLDTAGAKAMTASNAATLAMTAALSQQLEHIEEQLTEIRETLDGLVADADRARLAKAVAANFELQKIADNIRRRGEMTEADRTHLASISFPVTTSVIEVEFKFEEILDRFDPKMNRAERQEELERLHGKERLEYWLATRVEVELAQTRRDLLDLYWEQARHPETARELAESTRAAIASRQKRMQQLGLLLEELADPEARTRLDPLRQISRHRLKRQQEAVAELLGKHGSAFAGPDGDPFAVIAEPDPADALVLTAGESSDPASQ